MSYLRKRMTEDLQLRGLGTLTQQRYVRAVQQLAEHYGKSPDRITEEELRDYFRYLKAVKIHFFAFGIEVEGSFIGYHFFRPSPWQTGLYPRSKTILVISLFLGHCMQQMRASSSSPARSVRIPGLIRREALM